MLIVSPMHHLLVEKKTVPPIWVPHIEKCRQNHPGFWCANPWAFFVPKIRPNKKTKYIDVSQLPHQGDELKIH